MAENTKGKFTLAQEEGYDKTIAIPDCSDGVEKFMPELREDGAGDESDDVSTDDASDDHDDSGSSSASKRKSKGRSKKSKKAKSKKAKKEKKKKGEDVQEIQKLPRLQVKPREGKGSTGRRPKIRFHFPHPPPRIILKSLRFQSPKALDNAGEVMSQLLRVQARAEVCAGRLEKMHGTKATQSFSMKYAWCACNRHSEFA